MSQIGYPVRYYCSNTNVWYLMENSVLARGKEYACPGCHYESQIGIQTGAWYLRHINDMGNGHQMALATEYTRWALNPRPDLYKSYSHPDWTVTSNILKIDDRLFLPKDTLVRPLFRVGVDSAFKGTGPGVVNIAGIQEAFIPARLTRDVLVKDILAKVSPIYGRWGNAAGHGYMSDSYEGPMTVAATASMHDPYDMQVWWYSPIYSMQDRVTYYGMTICKSDE